MPVASHKGRVPITFTKVAIKQMEAEAAKRGLTVTKLVNLVMREAKII